MLFKTSGWIFSGIKNPKDVELSGLWNVSTTLVSSFTFFNIKNLSTVGVGVDTYDATRKPLGKSESKFNIIFPFDDDTEAIFDSIKFPVPP